MIEFVPGVDHIGRGLDLEPETLVWAYRNSLFPMPGRRHLDWFSPDPRGVLPLDALRVSRSLRRSCTRLSVTVDGSFDEVVAGCADPRRPGGWINAEFRTAYSRLHALGIAHSIEVRDGTGALVGGLYGVSLGGLFAGESMFHTETDASKVALVALVELLRRAGPAGRLLDVQWWSPHLGSLGVVAIPRPDYLSRLSAALAVPAPDWADLRTE